MATRKVSREKNMDLKSMQVSVSTLSTRCVKYVTWLQNKAVKVVLTFQWLLNFTTKLFQKYVYVFLAPISPTANNPVRVLEEESRLNSILMLRNCVGERLTLEVALSQ